MRPHNAQHTCASKDDDIEEIGSGQMNHQDSLLFLLQLRTVMNKRQHGIHAALESAEGGSSVASHRNCRVESL